jgi:hypothetical protein
MAFFRQAADGTPGITHQVFGLWRAHQARRCDLARSWHCRVPVLWLGSKSNLEKPGFSLKSVSRIIENASHCAHFGCKGFKTWFLIAKAETGK